MNGTSRAFLAVLIAYGSFVSLPANPKEPEDTGEFTPVVRILVTGDSHITTIGDIQSFRFQRMIKLGCSTVREIYID